MCFVDMFFFLCFSVFSVEMRDKFKDFVNTLATIKVDEVKFHNYMYLTLKAPNKNCSRRHFNFVTFICRRK